MIANRYGYDGPMTALEFEALFWKSQTPFWNFETPFQEAERPFCKV